MNEVYTPNKMAVDTLWKAAEETCSGTRLTQLDSLDEGLAKVRFAHSVFEVLKTKRKKGETVRHTLERTILKVSPK